MKLNFIDSDSDSEDFLCDRYELIDAHDHDEIIAAYRQAQKAYPGQILLTLDDLAQALYTSMHASGKHRLDDTEGHDLSALPSHLFEDGVHRGYLSSKHEFYIVANNFRRQLEAEPDRPIERKASLLGDGESVDDFENANRDLASIMDEQAYFLQVPVANAHESVVAFPNGYFSCDLDPFEVFSLAREMDESYGYRLMGMGASYLAFLRDAALAPAQVDALIVMLENTFTDNFDDRLRDCIRQIVHTQDLLLLRYTE